MKILANLSKGQLFINGAVFKASCDVRSLANGRRGSDEVVRTFPGNEPYDPRPFPKGLWRITGVEWQKEKGFSYSTYGPVKIRTNAYHTVNVWELDKYGDYLRETEKQVRDECYWLHYAVSLTTWGCVRLASAEDAVMLGRIIEQYLGRGEIVELEVV